MTVLAAPGAGARVTDQEIFGHFESLGDNCEFGLAQRLAGVDPMGFFRFNFATMPALLRALECDFADVANPDQVEVYAAPNDELMVRIRPYKFQYHTHRQRGEAEIEALHAQQVKAIGFLARKLLADLRTGEKVFVRKGSNSETAEQIAPLLSALRRHGPATLLWVVPQDEAHPLGSAEVVEPGLLRGYIDRFAPYDDAYDFSRVWLDVCRSAYQLWRDGSPPGARVERSEAPAAGNLIRHSEQFGGSGWQRGPRAAARLSDTVRRLHANCAVTEHTLLEATRVETGDIYGYAIGHGLSPGSVYVASAWIWLPSDFQGQIVGMVFNGFASIHVANARRNNRHTWQRVWVSARLPPGVTRANPSLYVVGPAGARLFSTCWKLEIGVQPTDYDPRRSPPLVGRVRPPAAVPEVAATKTWKWYFAANANALKHCFDQIQVAVMSARKHTTLRPHCLVDGREDMAQISRQLAWLEQAGVTIILHEAELFQIVKEHFGAKADLFNGHWLRCDIPILETEEQFVLYTDIDVMFRGPLDLDDLQPKFLACAPEHRQDDFASFNSGVMVMNIAGLRDSRGALVDVLRDRLSWMPPHDDQGTLFDTYRNSWTRLPNPLNWKPYWGFRADAPIVHFHGPKPGTVRRMLAGEVGRYGPILEEMFRRNPEGYAKYFAEFEAILKDCPPLAPPPVAERPREAPPPMPPPVASPPVVPEPAPPAPEPPLAELPVPEPPVPEPAAPAVPQLAEKAADGIYRCVWLAQLAELGAAERLPYLPAATLEVPPLAFGEADFSHPAIIQVPPQGPGGVELRHPPVDAYVLRDVIVHGQFGMVTCGDAVVEESTVHLADHRIAGAEWLDGQTRLRLPELPVGGALPAAYHLFACNLDNYCHWLLDGVTRFNAAEVRGFGVLGEAGRDLVPLLSPPDAAWKRETVALLAPPDLRFTALPDRASVRVGRLLYIPEFSGGGLRPHRALLAVFDRMRAAAYAMLRAEPATPWRRLFISRADSSNRVLVNDAEVAAAAAAAGFERVVLAGMPVAEQVRLFAEATHILAPHGAGLTNLLFCRPGTAICELHADCYVHWSFRRLAALRGLRYGCLIGEHIPPRHAWVHHNRWRIDVAQVAATLADPRFIGG